MAGPILPTFWTYVLYPATLTTLSIIGTNYIIRKEIREVRDEVKLLKKDILEVKLDLKSLDKRQKDTDTYMALAMGLFEDCGKDA